MTHSASLLSGTLAVAALVGSLAFAGAVQAAGSESQPTASPPPPAAAAAPASPAATAPAHGTAAHMARVFSSNSVEARIKELHGKLAIKPSQQAAWDQLATVMRENGRAMERLAREEYAKSDKMSALDDLRSYGALTDAHAAALKSFTAAFKTLYDGMSPAQRKNADALFRNRLRMAKANAAPKGQ